MLAAVPALSSHVVDSIFFFFLALSVLLLALITTLMVVFVVKYRRSKHPRAEHIEGNNLLEIIWTAVPTVLVLCMFYWGWMGYRYLRLVPDDAMVVHVTAAKWSWMFRYDNGKLANELHVPVGKPVKLLMQSRDVIHSFFVPAFRVKQDIVPGSETYLWFETDEPGQYDIMCAEYCGERHSYMLSKVIAMPADEYELWYASKDTDHPGLQVIKLKGCASCHTVDGNKLVGRSFKGIYGKPVTVLTDGKEQEIMVDEDYIRRSILDPKADVVKGFPPSMPDQRDIVTDMDIENVIEYLKTIS